MWRSYICVESVNQALSILAEYGPRARLVAGATDLILEVERGVRQGIEVWVDITRIPGLDSIFIDSQDVIHLGPLVTHNQCAASELIVQRAFPLAQAAWEVGAPQIRNRGTIAGNLITASPANDTITPLMALDARVVLASRRGQREVALRDFYTGVRRVVMQPDELLLEIKFPAMPSTAHGTFIKLGLRRAQAISIVNAAVVLDFEDRRVRHAAVALGSVAPTIIRSSEAERILRADGISAQGFAEAARAAAEDCRPISDVRGSAEYRREMVRVAVRRALEIASSGAERRDYPASPVLLRKPYPIHPIYARFDLSGDPAPIVTRINGREMRFDSGHQKTLLHLLRDEAGLVGTKEGCSEGECGACTVILDGMAVMSCLVPAPRAHNAEIVTIEGLRDKDRLHPLQEAFIHAGAVQCGYCTPGFLMSAAMLMEERSQVSRQDIQQAITGNLCRCTGYYKIVAAIEQCFAMPRQPIS